MTLRTLRIACGVLGLSVIAFSVGCSGGREGSTDDAQEAALTGSFGAGRAAVTSGNVRLRAEPSLSGAVLRMLPAATNVTLVDGDSHDGFYQVTLEDGAAGYCFGGYLRLESPSVPAPAPAPAVGEATGETFQSRGTGYFPDSSALEGGFVDRRGAPLRTLQDFLNGNAAYVSVAMDTHAFPYGQKLRIKELEAEYGRPIEFRVVDTGGAFVGRGRSRIDICTASQSACLDPVINGSLTLTLID